MSYRASNPARNVDQRIRAWSLTSSLRKIGTPLTVSAAGRDFACGVRAYNLGGQTEDPIPLIDY